MNGTNMLTGKYPCLRLFSNKAEIVGRYLSGSADAGRPGEKQRPNAPTAQVSPHSSWLRASVDSRPLPSMSNASKAARIQLSHSSDSCGGNENRTSQPHSGGKGNTGLWAILRPEISHGKGDENSNTLFRSFAAAEPHLDITPVDQRCDPVAVIEFALGGRLQLCQQLRDLRIRQAPLPRLQRLHAWQRKRLLHL